MEVEKENNKMGFMETELRLGLPGNNNNNNINEGESRKRGFCETVDLKLNFQESDDHEMEKKQNLPKEKNLFSVVDPAKPPAPKVQVVGWPPVRSYRKNVMLAVQKSNNNSEESEKASFVKVSMDGAPYLRKVDLNMYKGYRELSDALSNMFSSFTIGNCGSQGMKDFLNESKLVDVLNGIDCVPTYEDKDGDWMLVGDVPWEMFVQSCKRLRLMKGTEATGLAPRAMEKRKNKS